MSTGALLRCGAMRGMPSAGASHHRTPPVVGFPLIHDGRVFFFGARLGVLAAADAFCAATSESLIALTTESRLMFTTCGSMTGTCSTTRMVSGDGCEAIDGLATSEWPR